MGRGSYGISPPVVVPSAAALGRKNSIAYGCVATRHVYVFHSLHRMSVLCVNSNGRIQARGRDLADSCGFVHSPPAYLSPIVTIPTYCVPSVN